MSNDGSEYDEDLSEVDGNYIGVSVSLKLINFESYGDSCTFIQEYVGERSEDGKRHGFGRAILPNRDQYEGKYRDGLRHGAGCYVFKESGARYEGEWKKGFKHGHGKFFYPNGSVYCGEWKENKKHGFGKYTYDNGDVYEGGWKNSAKHGLGTYKYQECDVIYRGSFVDGVPKGQIEIVYPNNMRYYGSWKENFPIAEGTFTFDMKYMQPGHIEMIPEPIMTRPSLPTDDDEIVEVKLSDENQKPTNQPKCTPHFITHEITKYDYSKLPQHPIAPPQSDSSKSSICSKASSSSEIEVHLYQVQSPILIAADDCIDDEADE